MTQEEYSAVCPYLGLADDADSHATYATEAHRCFRLPNPTKIATPHQETYCLGANHVTCPVYLGEGVPQTQTAAPAPTIAAVPLQGGSADSPVRGPRPGGQPRRPGGTEPQRPRKAGGGSPLGPRPRAGGISMPVATIGLFALAIVVVALAFAIQRLVGDDDNSSVSPADAVATRDALNKTRTAQAGGGNQTQPPQTTQTQQPAGSQTPGASQTGTASRTTTATTSGTPGTGKTYTVKSGDTCGAIAEANGITLAALLAANNLTEAACSTLAIGQILKLP